MNKKIFTIIGILVFLGVGIGGFFLYQSQTNVAIHPVGCYVYWGYDVNKDDGQIIAMDPVTKIVRPVGPVYAHAEFDGLAIHPKTGILYTNSKNAGDLYQIDGISGERSFVGTLPVTDVTALAFHPRSYELWAWAEGRGLISLDPDTLQVLFKYNALDIVTAIAWNNEGTFLYGAFETGEFVAYDPVTHTLEELANNFPFEVEGFSMLKDGTILAMNKDEDAEITRFFVYDPKKLETVREFEIQSEYVGSVGVAWPPACGAPF